MKQALLPVAAAPAKVDSSLTDLIGPYGCEEVVLTDLRIDDYQRGVKQHARWIAANFCPEAAGVLLVGRRSDGSCWLVDGQQRAQAMVSRQIAKWPCIIFDSRGQEHEAHVFNKVNGPEGRKGLSWYEIWKGKKCEGDPVVIACETMAAEFGLRIGGGGSDRKNVITCPEILYRQVKWGKAEHLKQSLWIATTAWPGFREGYSHTMLAAMIRFVTEFEGKADLARLVEKVRHVSPVLILEEAAKGLKASKVHKVLRVLVAKYNAQLRSNRLVLEEPGQRGE